jgi:hypothetical protein
MRPTPSRLLRVRVFIVLVFVLTLAAVAQGQTGTGAQVDPAATPAFVFPSPGLRASPRVIQPVGAKLPSSMNLAVLENCDDPKALDLSHDKLLITGGGLALLPPQNASKCVIQTTLEINPNTPAGTYTIIVVDSTGVPVGSTDISVLDAAAGAIPPGLEPEVDVIWGVMTQNNCSDVFGKRVAQSLYCIQLKVGNNSGHPLQIAGVGFAKSLQALAAIGIPQVTIANTSYSSTRAVLVESQVWSGRNLIYNTFAGAGLIMAASSPFYFGTGPSALRAKTRFLSLSTIVSGPLLQAFNIILPDPIVSQLKSLDDQSFRDNMVIPNNSQIQTVVFVEKQNLTMALRETQMRLRDAASQVLVTAKTLGTDTAEAKTARHYAKKKAETLDKMASDSQDTVDNSTRPWLLKGKHDPLLVKLALGSVVIVGDEIQYLHRVQIQNSATTGSALAIAINPAAPQVPIATTQAFTATVANDQNGAGVTWGLSGLNCAGAACGTLTSATTTTVTYTAPATGPNPNNTVTITATSKADSTKSGTATVTITPPALSVAIAPNPAPAATHGGPAISFTVTLQNDPTNAGVTWSLSGGGCAGTTCGAFAASTPTSVTYNPPAVQPQPNTVTLTATSRSDQTKSDAVTISIN